MFTKTVKIIGLVAVLSITTVVEASWREFKKCARQDVAHFNGSIADLVTENQDTFGTLLFALQATGLDSALAADGNFTVFAPTDAAFEAVPADILNAIIGTEGVLPAVLLYHVVDRKIDPRKNALRRSVETLAGQKLYFGREGGLPKVNNSNIGCKSGVRTNNGIVWVIDSVLLPQF